MQCLCLQSTMRPKTQWGLCMSQHRKQRDEMLDTALHPSPSPRGDSNSPVPWSGVHASAHLHKGVASRGECTGAELVAFAQHPGRVGRSIPIWDPEERRLSPLENSYRWSASASAPRPVIKQLVLNDATVFLRRCPGR